MNALAAITNIAMPRVDVTALGMVIAAVQGGATASRSLDADVMTALGWQVDRARWTMRSPFSARPVPLPRLSKRLDCARFVLPFGWDWSAGERKGAGHARCSDGQPMQEGSLWFETKGRTPALALLLALLFGQRALVVDHKASPMPAFNEPFNGVQCRCDWAGPTDALHYGDRCPDCGTHILIGDRA